MKKRKKKDKKKSLKLKATNLTREVCRLRDNDMCQKCGAKGKRLHTSHVYPKGKYKSLEFELANVKTLCMRCHLYWWHLNPIEATAWFEAKFPERAENLRLLKNRSFLVNETYIEQQIIKLKEQKAMLLSEL